MAVLIPKSGNRAVSGSKRSRRKSNLNQNHGAGGEVAGDGGPQRYFFECPIAGS